MLTLQKKYALVISPDRGPCAYVRWRQWQHLIDSSMGGECYLLVMDEPLYDEYLLAHTATVVISRPTSEKQIDMLKAYARLKKKFGFDLCVEMDDLLFSVQGKDVIPPWNPHPIDTAAVNVFYQEIKDRVDRWLPSTDFIAYALCKEFEIPPEKVQVLPNYSFTSCFWDEHKPSRKKHIDVFYTGSCCHYKEGNRGDLDGPWIEGITLAMERGYIKFHAFGEDPGILPRGTILHEQVYAGLWASTISHYCPDVLISPLANHPFNKAKSNLKILECAAIGAVPVASVFPGSPYVGLTPKLCAVTPETTEDELLEIFRTLTDAAVRKECVNTVRKTVANKGLVAEMKSATDHFLKCLYGRFLEIV